MSAFLQTILDEKRREVALLRHRQSEFHGRTSARRAFCASLDRRPHLGMIAEVKKASPSKGLIVRDFDHVSIGRTYERGGASAISVLTDRMFFQGDTQYLTDVRAAVSLPVLRKDFIVDPLQVEETAHLNADAMLLIAAALSDAQMSELYAAAAERDVEVLIEVHNAEELDRTLALSPGLVGINNRNLSTFEVSLHTTVNLMGRMPTGVVAVSESGIFTVDDARTVRNAGVRAVLVGESLMRSADPAALIGELTHAGAH